MPIRHIAMCCTVRDMMGLNAYMERGALNRLMGEGDLSSQFTLALEQGTEAQTLQATRSLPRVAGTFSKATLRANMQQVSGRNVRIMSTVMTAFAAVIAVGIVYNAMRIALSERSWELASLRVLGFRRAEVSGLLLGEMAIAVVLALPLGMALGWLLVHGVAQLLASDQFLFPVVIRPRTYALADLLVLPSVGHGETWGLCINEAMNLAKPVLVSSHVGCGPDLVIPGETGWIFPAGDRGALQAALAHALADPQRLAAMGQAARAHIDRFSYGATTAGLLQALKLVCP
jgi:hypothetical protein